MDEALRTQRSWKIGGAIFLVAVLVPVLNQLRLDYGWGGDPWRQGDWLINFGDGPVRRGLIGEVLIWFSDTFRLPLLETVFAVQLLLVGALFVMLLSIWAESSHRGLLTVLAASPVFFAVSWAGAPEAAMRKEIFAYLAMASLVLAAKSPRQSLTFPVLATISYALGCIGNILHVFLLPVFLLGLFWVFTQGNVTRSGAIILGSLACLVAGSSFLFALFFKEIASYAAVCDPLIARGLGPGICSEAIRWLVAGEVDHAAAVAIHMQNASPLRYLAMFAFALLPVALVLWVVPQKGRVMFIVMISFVPLAPLYLIATDWGRWFSISYSSAAFLVVLALAGGQLKTSRRIPRFIVFGSVALGAASILAR